MCSTCTSNTSLCCSSCKTAACPQCLVADKCATCQLGLPAPIGPVLKTATAVWRQTKKGTQMQLEAGRYKAEVLTTHAVKPHEILKVANVAQHRLQYPAEVSKTAKLFAIGGMSTWYSRTWSTSGRRIVKTDVLSSKSLAIVVKQAKSWLSRGYEARILMALPKWSEDNKQLHQEVHGALAGLVSAFSAQVGIILIATTTQSSSPLLSQVCPHS